ncbi:hypothetical protein Ga0074812_13144 [Parafrankia irregularis]|uniref:Uncharacterized protein n=1 Tax=Parafrankia irregularis TaxID=795642 RepID=A0A0S4QXG7_9ACTN|nr:MULTISPECIES: hypothetical protein [Frankiaceae]KPM50359.1 hypothetical protein ACG83_40815 [Frankia sp. R43]MBE3204774.1 hypothetical protein [Parafrankia sp. CH37]CUU59746.1 hypothetical protein Ga0074812_13144 [Parafrankia irregularis]
MDDRQRLLRLVSLVAWAGEPGSDRSGLRFANTEDERQWNGPTAAWVAGLERGEVTPEPEGDQARAALWRLASWYAVAVRSGNDPAGGDIDTREFSGVAYYAVDGLPDGVLAVLGRMVRTWLNFNFDVDEVSLARRWAEDVQATAWRLLVAEQFSRHA